MSETSQLNDGEEVIETGEITLDQTKINFSGNAKEYFGIWIVNLILSIITVGIYSAWAKVRRETYFKNNTKVFDMGFGYHATGGQILKGRIIAFIVLALVNVLASVDPIYGIILTIMLIALLPWILNSSLRFSARMTSFRNIRFNWHGTYWETMWFLVIAPVIGLLTLGLLTPLFSKYYYSYFANSHSYGTTRFTANPIVSDYYLAFLMGGILPAIFLGILGYLILGIIEVLNGGSLSWLGFIVTIFYSLIFCLTFIYPVLCRNLMVSSLALDSIVSFDSQIDPLKFVWISISNLVLTVVSLGLLLPWAKVRMYKYLSSMTFVTADGNIDSYIDEQIANRSSLGEAVADFEGIEVSI